MTPPGMGGPPSAAFLTTLGTSSHQGPSRPVDKVQSEPGDTRIGYHGQRLVRALPYWTPIKTISQLKGTMIFALLAFFFWELEVD